MATPKAIVQHIEEEEEEGAPRELPPWKQTPTINQMLKRFNLTHGTSKSTKESSTSLLDIAK